MIIKILLILSAIAITCILIAVIKALIYISTKEQREEIKELKNILDNHGIYK
jgi:signal transduction histidine kinase